MWVAVLVIAGQVYMSANLYASEELCDAARLSIRPDNIETSNCFHIRATDDPRPGLMPKPNTDM
jgi:hypothetical protein